MQTVVTGEGVALVRLHEVLERLPAGLLAVPNAKDTEVRLSEWSGRRRFHVMPALMFTLPLHSVELSAEELPRPLRSSLVIS